MEENEAKTTEAAVDRTAVSPSGADAGTATSERAAQAAKDFADAPEGLEPTGCGDAKGSRTDGSVQEVQTREQNRENARRRREAEKEALIRQTREATVIEALDGKNPYTGEPMRDALDVEEYFAMKEIVKNGGDPLSDYSKYRKDREREAVRTEEERTQREAWYRHDREAFVERYPDVQLDALIADKRFRSFARGKTGEMPLAEIYEGFIELVGEYEEDARSMAAQMLANQKASPGSLRTAQSAESDYFTPEQVRKMSSAEVRTNYEKIRNSMTKWK